MGLNTPVVTREASGTSGMSAAMNGSVNLSTYDGWTVPTDFTLAWRTWRAGPLCRLLGGRP